MLLHVASYPFINTYPRCIFRIPDQRQEENRELFNYCSGWDVVDPVLYPAYYSNVVATLFVWVTQFQVSLVHTSPQFIVPGVVDFRWDIFQEKGVREIYHYRRNCNRCLMVVHTVNDTFLDATYIV